MIRPGRENTAFAARTEAMRKWGRGHIVRDSAGRAVRVIGAMRDLSEQRQHEQALRDVEQQFRAVTMNAPVAIFIKDLEGKYTLCNPLASQALGRPRGVVGLTDYDLLPREAADSLRARDQQVIAAGEAAEFEEIVPLVNTGIGIGIAIGIESPGT